MHSQEFSLIHSGVIKYSENYVGSESIKHFITKLAELRHISKGLLFIWVPKHLISEVDLIFEDYCFQYVENVAVVEFDRAKVNGISIIRNEKHYNGRGF